MMKVLDEGRKVYGYRCPLCGRKILTTERLEDLTCANCGDTMEQTNLKKESEQKPEDQPSGGGIPVKKSTDGCTNCCYSRKGSFEINGETKPGCRCLKDGRTHSPYAKCSEYSRRGRKPRQI